jgi:hypothetical protein
MPGKGLPVKQDRQGISLCDAADWYDQGKARRLIRSGDNPCERDGAGSSNWMSFQLLALPSCQNIG